MAWALLAGLLLRIAFVHWRPEVSGDTLLYGEIAQNLLRHHLYGRTTATLHPTWIRLPGYPLFLAASFLVFGPGRYYPVLWVNVVLDLVTCVLVGALAGRLGGPRVGRIALWIAVLCPFTANYCAVALTETPSLLCVATAFFALQRFTEGPSVDPAPKGARFLWAALAGAALSAAVLLRPEQGLMSAAVVPAMVWVSWRARPRVGLRAILSAMSPVVLSCAIVLLPLLGWGIRNARVMGHFEPLAPKSATDPGEPVPEGFDHWFRTWGVDFKSTYDIYWNYDGAGLALTDLPARAIDNTRQRTQTEHVFAGYNAVQLERPEFDAQFERIAEERERLHPIRTRIVLPVARVANMWLRPRTELLDLPLDWWDWRLHPRGSSYALALGVLNLAFLCAASLGAWRERHRLDAVRLAMLSFVALRSALLLTLDNSEPRYTLECFPVLIVFAALAFGRDAQSSGTRKQRAIS